MIKVILTVILIPLTFGVVFGLISSYRAGQKPHEPVFLVFKNFAQQIFRQHTLRHVRLYWMYYTLLIMFVMVALGN